MVSAASLGATAFTQEGATAFPYATDVQKLRRSVMACMLWEQEFYESGEEIGARIYALARLVPVEELAAIAVEARTKMKLRHVALYLAAILAQNVSLNTEVGIRCKDQSLVQDTIATVIDRADELTEFLALYAKINGVPTNKIKSKLSHQVRKGIARAFLKFDEYQLAKYDRATAIRLRDALFLSHANPGSWRAGDGPWVSAAIDLRADLFKRLVNNELKTPDTWETQLSAGGDKKAVFTRLIQEKKLGYLATLRNVRNMRDAGVDDRLVRERIVGRKGADRVLPFRYVAAARACPAWEPMIDEALIACIGDMPVLKGNTVVLVDVSGSMDHPISAKSDLKRIDAAAALAAVISAESLRVFTFSNRVVEVAPRRGMSGVDAVSKSQEHGGTYLAQALATLAPHLTGTDRLIVITDEQSSDRVLMQPPAKRGYMINVASAKNGVGYGGWTHVDGFSEHFFDYIREAEGGI